MESQDLNPRWVVSVIAERGLPTLDTAAVRRGISLWPRSHSEFKDLVTRLHRGIDQDGDLEAMYQWIRQVRETQKGDHGNEPVARLQTAQIHKSLPDYVAVRTEAETTEKNRSAASHPERHLQQRTTHHVYGKSAALCAEPTIIEKDDTPPFHTIAIEVAPAQQSGGIKFAWDRKVTLRLTRRELPQYAAVLMGMTSELLCANHGPNNDKSLSIKVQGSNLYVSVRQGSRAMALPVPPEELFDLAAMAITTVALNYPSMDGATVLALVKRCGHMYAQS